MPPPRSPPARVDGTRTSAGSSGSGGVPAHQRAAAHDRAPIRKTIEARAWSVVIGNGQFADGGIRLSPRSFPGDGVLDALVFTGPKSDAYRMLPRIFRHGDHLPDPNIKELRAKLKIEIASPKPLPVVADGRPSRHHARRPSRSSRNRSC